MVFYQAEDEKSSGVLVPDCILESSEFLDISDFGENRCQQRYDNGVADA